MSISRRLRAWTLVLSSLAVALQADSIVFKSPAPQRYEIQDGSIRPQAATITGPQWVSALRQGAARSEQLGSRVVLGVHDPETLAALLRDRPLQIQRSYGAGIYVLQAPDALTAIQQAADLATFPEVHIAQPIRRHHAALHSQYGSRPTDRYYARQWHMENLPPDVGSLTVRADVNARGAWPLSMGEGVLIANADDGVDKSHPDLSPNYDPTYERNFHTLTNDGSHSTRFQYHGTATAGLHSAAGNSIGGLGVAPKAHFTSWVIFDSASNIPDEQTTADMFQYQSNSIPVQNHSWGNADFEPLLPGPLEYIAVSNAATAGRNGRGVVMVRSSGNMRTGPSSFQGVGDANLDGYANDPHAIAVAAVNITGHFANYSTPGACVLVAAPGGESSSGNSIFTTDPVGVNGRNFSGSPDDPDLADYIAGSIPFYGTSAAAPLISGVVALVLSVRPELSYRDVQQILVLSARHTDAADADIRPNGAGFRVSHNTGFGVPDAGVAVRLAQTWPLRPALTRVTALDSTEGTIPDDGLIVEVTGDGVPASLTQIHASGSDGWHADDPTASVPVVSVGQAATILTNDVNGKAALIQRGPSSVTFRTKLTNAVNAGAAFAIVYNNEGTTERMIMRDTDPVPIIGVLIGRTDGEALLAQIQTNANARVALRLNSLVRTFAITNSLLCEHVGVRVRTAHNRMGDLRVTLRSPAGTVSVLHRSGMVKTAVPVEMTYWSTHHFFENSAGQWTVAISDEASGTTGTVSEVELIVHGTPLEDTDRDGLGDAWELSHFGSLESVPQADPDADGWSHAAEQLKGTDPLQADEAFLGVMSRQDATRVRLSWPGTSGRTYSVESAPTIDGPFSTLGTVPGRFPESGLLLDSATADGRYYRIRF